MWYFYCCAGWRYIVAFTKVLTSQVLVTHACNPSYSGDRDQEDHGSKQTQANSSLRPYLENLFTKTGLVK
jgi:hypothetical protein